MMLSNTVKVTKNIKFHFCQQCNYKSPKRWNLARHVYSKHREKPQRTEPNKTCQKCNFTFTRFDNYRVHSQKCKVKLRKQMIPEDCINLMRVRDVNFRDLKEFERMTKKLFGRNAVQSKLRDTLNDAVKDYEEYFSAETVILQRKNKRGKYESFKTCVSYTSDLNKYADLFCRAFNLDPNQVNWVVEVDGGQGKNKVKDI